MVPLNQQMEVVFRHKIQLRPGNALITDPDELEKIILKAAQSGGICVADNKNCKTIVDQFMYRLAWHPVISFQLTPNTPRDFDIKCIWQLQVTQMHDLCRDLGEQWAWEYLWKNWYIPDNEILMK